MLDTNCQNIIPTSIVPPKIVDGTNKKETLWSYRLGLHRLAVADLGFPVGGRGLPRWLHFENFVCQNERILTLRGAWAGHAPSRSANGLVYNVFPTISGINSEKREQQSIRIVMT